MDDPGSVPVPRALLSAVEISDMSREGVSIRYSTSEENRATTVSRLVGADSESSYQRRSSPVTVLASGIASAELSTSQMTNAGSDWAYSDRTEVMLFTAAVSVRLSASRLVCRVGPPVDMRVVLIAGRLSTALTLGSSEFF